MVVGPKFWSLFLIYFLYGAKCVIFHLHYKKCEKEEVGLRDAKGQVF